MADTAPAAAAGPARCRVLVVTAVAAERAAVLAAAPEPPAEPAGGAAAPAPGGALPPPVSARFGADGGLAVDVLAAGVGPAAAAAATATALARTGYDLVVSAGIGGGFAPTAPLGAVVVASRVVAADLGAQLPAGADARPEAASAREEREGAAHGPGAPREPADPAPAGAAPGFADVAALGFGTAAHRPPADLARALAAAAGAVLGPVLTVSTATGTAARAAELAARHPGAAAEAMEGFGVAEAAAQHGVPALEVRAVSNAVGPRDRAAWRVPEALRALTDAFARMAPVLDGWRWDRG